MTPRPSLPRVYFAGKIEKNCWRHRIVPALGHLQFADGAIVTQDFVYTGPHFVGCDHGGYHGPTTHGAMEAHDPSCCPGFSRDSTRRRDIISRCHSSIENSDVVFAYINAHECYGTMCEIQLAAILGKHLVIALAPGIATPDRNEFWFASHQCNRVEFNVEEAELPALIRRVLGSLP